MGSVYNRPLATPPPRPHALGELKNLESGVKKKSITWIHQQASVIALRSENPPPTHHLDWQTPLMQIRSACDEQQKQDKQHQQTTLEPRRFQAPRTKPHDHTNAALPDGSRRPQTAWRTRTGNRQEKLPPAAAHLDGDVTEIIRFGAGSIFRVTHALCTPLSHLDMGVYVAFPWCMFTSRAHESV